MIEFLLGVACGIGIVLLVSTKIDIKLRVKRVDD